MEIFLKIIGVAAIVGACIAYFGGKKTGEDAAAGAAAGALFAGSCLFQLIIYGLIAFAGLWLLGKIFL